MEINQMRVYISQHPLYKHSPAWVDRCQRMPSNQVVAIYNNFKKLDYKKIEREMKKREKTNAQYHQIDMFEYMEELNDEQN